MSLNADGENETRAEGNVWTVTDLNSFNQAAEEIKRKRDADGLTEATIVLTQDITFKAEDYTDSQYIGDNYFSGIENVTLTLTSDENGPHTIKRLGVYCGYPVSQDITMYAQWKKEGEIIPDPAYKITYTDGVDDAEIFKDQVYENVKPGSKTPAFSGTPVREGYIFKGWSPEVAETVTQDAVYTAQWEKKTDDGG